MRLSEATSLVDVDVHEHDPHEDIQALCELAEGAQQFSPLVGLETLDKKMWAGRTLLQPECLLLDVTGIPALFGGEEELLRAVCRWLSAQHCFGCLGLAGSVGAAWALANYRTRLTLPDTTVVQVLASDQPTPQKRAADEKPAELDSGLPACRAVRAASGEDAHALAELPLMALRLEPATIASLHRLGVRNIGQLQQLPRAGMATRLGDTLLLRWDQATGQKAEPILTHQAAPDWQLEQTLEFPTQHRQTMSELVRRLAHSLAQRLERRGEGALRIVCRLDLVEAPPLVMQLSLFRPTADGQHLELLLNGQLEQQLAGYRAPSGSLLLWRLSLQATLTAALVWRQSELFEAGETASRQQLARLIDTLSTRLGRRQVLGAQLRREAQPELACGLQPLTGRRPDGGQQETIRKLSSRLSRARGEPARDDPQRRPTQLFSPPVPIQVSHGAAAAAPVRFYHQGVWLEIVHSTGPERLESGWWRGPSVRRDYYRIATSQAGWWWIFRELNTNQWYLHGAFD